MTRGSTATASILALVPLLTWWQISVANESSVAALAVCLTTLTLYAGRDLCVVVGINAGVPQPPGEEGTPLSSSARRLARYRLLFVVAVAVSAGAFDWPSLIALGMAGCALSSAVTRGHFYTAYGGPSWGRNLLSDFVDQAVLDPASRAVIRSRLHASLWVGLLIAFLGVVTASSPLKPVRQELATVGLRSLYEGLTDDGPSDQAAEDVDKVPEPKGFSEEVPSTSPAQTPATTTIGPFLTDTCSSASLELPHPSHHLRETLEDRWHYHGGLVMGCPDRVTMLNDATVVWFAGGESDPAALVATSVDDVALVRGDHTDVLERLIDEATLSGVDELQRFPGLEYQLFHHHHDCAMSVQVYDGQHHELSGSSTAAVLTTVATIGGTISSVQLSLAPERSTLTVIVSLNETAVPVEFEESDEGTIIVDGPERLIGSSTGVDATCPLAEAAEVASRS